jgi:hypothetical protein
VNFFLGMLAGLIGPPKGFICTCGCSSSGEGAGKSGEETADMIGFERRACECDIGCLGSIDV